MHNEVGVRSGVTNAPQEVMKKIVVIEQASVCWPNTGNWYPRKTGGPLQAARPTARVDEWRLAQAKALDASERVRYITTTVI